MSSLYRVFTLVLLTLAVVAAPVDQDTPAQDCRRSVDMSLDSELANTFCV
ncbi:hypothetical protein BKA62DRAFT_774491 [Auriculariales sp. MPI-PUGE-AT-0066]|nr:hypothetical protein BKA62DRAFT_774491 [Auriculariales sp. MPI-PUGE-AT-0066]